MDNSRDTLSEKKKVQLPLEVYMVLATQTSIATRAKQEQTSCKAVHDRVREIAEATAQRDGRFVGDILFEHDQQRWSNGVITCLAEFMMICNGRAALRLKDEKTNNLRVVPLISECVFVARTRCSDHEFCKERYLRKLAH